MKPRLEISRKIKLNQQVKHAGKGQVDACGALVVVLASPLSKKSWPTFPYSKTLRSRFVKAKPRACDTPGLTTDLPNNPGTRTVCACITAAIDAFSLLSLARKMAADALATEPAQIVIQLVGLDTVLGIQAAEALVTAILAAISPMPSFKQGKDQKVTLKEITICGLDQALDFRRIRAESAGNYLARWLTSLPGNELTPKIYQRMVSALAREKGWKMDFYGSHALARKKAGAFLAVAQGSPNRDAGILRLRYQPTGKGARSGTVALVGKGICFDTGGVNIKPARYMNSMQGDMEGSAVALGTLLALTELRAPFPLDCWLALAENHVGPKAYKPNDVVRAANGTTIEIIHTDAEGRMVLADTLALAGKTKPILLIDYATLTGSCIQALGSRYSGAFCNREEFLPRLIASGKRSGERVWPFPLDPDYDEFLDSKVADIKQCTLGGEADHILAARFLSRFVPKDCAWVHIDLSAGSNKGGLAHIPSEFTGFGVRYTLDLLLDEKLPA